MPMTTFIRIAFSPTVNYTITRLFLNGERFIWDAGRIERSEIATPDGRIERSEIAHGQNKYRPIYNNLYFGMGMCNVGMFGEDIYNYFYLYIITQ